MPQVSRRNEPNGCLSKEREETIREGRTAKEWCGVLRSHIGLTGTIVLKALLPSFSYEQQQIPKDGKRNNTYQQEVFLQKAHSLRILLVHERLIEECGNFVVGLYAFSLAMLPCVVTNRIYTTIKREATSTFIPRITIIQLT